MLESLLVNQIWILHIVLAQCRKRMQKGCVRRRLQVILGICHWNWSVPASPEVVKPPSASPWNWSVPASPEGSKTPSASPWNCSVPASPEVTKPPPLASPWNWSVPASTEVAKTPLANPWNCSVSALTEVAKPPSASPWKSGVCLRRLKLPSPGDHHLSP